jgi:hypothetical protein
MSYKNKYDTTLSMQSVLAFFILLKLSNVVLKTSIEKYDVIHSLHVVLVFCLMTLQGFVQFQASQADGQPGNDLVPGVQNWTSRVALLAIAWAETKTCPNSIASRTQKQYHMNNFT